MLVRVCQSRRYLSAVADHRRDGQRSAIRQLLERAALDQLHGHVNLLAHRVRVVNPANMWMV